MYIVRDRENKKIIHINPAPLTQKLGEKEVYARFDASRMEIGQWEGGIMPGAFSIDQNGMVVAAETARATPADDQPTVAAPGIDPGTVASKTLSQRVADGEITLLPHQKIVGQGPSERVGDKSLAECVEDGTVTILPDQKMIGKGKSAKIVNKSPAELLKDGMIRINEPFDYLDGDTIGRRSLEELVEEKLLKTAAQRKTAQAMLDQRIEAEILAAYSPGREMKLLKEYIDWHNEGQPKKDDRQKLYLKMQKDIAKIKSKYAKLRDGLFKIGKS